MPIVGLLMLSRWEAYAGTICRLMAADGHVWASTGLAECDSLAAVYTTPNSLRFPLRRQHDHRYRLGRIGAQTRRNAAKDRRPVRPREAHDRSTICGLCDNRPRYRAS